MTHSTNSRVGGNASNKTLDTRVPSISHELLAVTAATIVLFIISALVAPGTLRSSSLVAMLPFVAMLIMVGVGQTLVIQQRGVDLSVFGVVVLSGILVSKYGTDSLILGVFLALAAGAVVGFLNGFLVSVVHITPLVATLATNALLVAAVRSVSGGFPAATSPALKEFAQLKLLGVPLMVFLAILLVTIAAITLRKTVIGRRFVAVGANEEGANAAGINVLRYRIGTYMVAGLCFATAGILLAGKIGTAYTNAGSEYLLASIAVVVIGGTPFTGGKGSVVATAVASLFLIQLGQMVLAVGAPTSLQLLVQALAIVVATCLQHINWRKR